MSKSITIPDIGQNPIILRINNTDYVFHAGETQTVPDEVAALLAGIVDSFPKPASDGYRTNPATIGDVEDMIAAAGGGDKLPEVTTDDNGKFLGVTEGEWAKADATSGSGAYAVDFEVTGFGTEEQVISTEADFDSCLDAIQSGKVVRAKIDILTEQGISITISLPFVALAVLELDGQGARKVARFQVCTDFEEVPTLVSIEFYNDPQKDPELVLTPLATS